MNTTQLGTAKIIYALVVIVAAILVGIFTKDWTPVLVILSSGGVTAGIFSGMGLVKAQDAPTQ